MEIRTSNSRTRDIFNLHSHSRFSSGDALPQVHDMVKTVVAMGQPALGLTDHGNMAGSVQLYQQCRKAGILPFPGTEIYVVRDRTDKKAKRHHMCIAAYTTQGYENLVHLSTLSHKNFHNKPLIDHGDLAILSEQGLLAGLVGTSGCYFGYVAQAISQNNYADAEALLLAYNSWFTTSGGMFVIEMQNHNIDHGNGHNDDTLAETLLGFSDMHGIPAILTQDSHYCHQDDKNVHEALKRIVSFGPDPEDAVFPGDGFHLASAEWFQEHHSPDRYLAGYEGLGMLLDAHDLKIPELDNYSYNIPFTVDDPLRQLRRECYEALVARDLSDEHEARLIDELSIIGDTGMAGYLVMVKEVTDYCREANIFFQARGSASGSMICYLLGITQVDPLKWGISFERFMSRDRTKPPDIDIDVEHDRRQEIIDWLATRFAVQQVGTWGRYSIAGDDEESTGSLRVKYFARQRAIGQPIDSWDDVPAYDKEMMRQIADFKTTSNAGKNAAGIVLESSHRELDRLIPMMWIASSKTMVTQYYKDDVESLGKVKLDLLGVKTLSVIHKCLDNIGKDFRDGLDWIPLNDKATYRTISQGRTDGVFQLEGWSSKRGCKDLKPTKISDVIASMALFRPAPQNSGATNDYIQRKNKVQEIPQRHEVLMKHTRSTYGIFLYQEQVIYVLRDMGMGADDLTRFLKAVKASNSDIGDAGKVIEGFKEEVQHLAVLNGVPDEDFNWMWDAVTGFAAYGFNLAHSTVYGITAYISAYLATNYELEFYAALLNVFAGSAKQGKDKKSKEEIYLLAAKQLGIRILPAHINASGVSYEVDPGRMGIRKGLMGVKGIGEKTARRIVSVRPEGGYKSVHEVCRLSKISGSGPFLESGDLQVGSLGHFSEYGALDDLVDEGGVDGEREVV